MSYGFFKAWKQTTLVLAMVVFSSCVTPSGDERGQIAQSVTGSQGHFRMGQGQGALPIKRWERIKKTKSMARIYIEGDGLAFLSRSRQSPDPTPTNPVALRLAAQDPSDNVVWLGRPCQYVENRKQTACHPRYWTSARFAPEIIAAMDRELTNLKSMYDIQSFELIGFSGGGAVAALLAAKRNDVSCFRTVAGNVDHVAFNVHHKVKPMTESLNAADYSAQLSGIPQYHYVGGADKVVPVIVAQSYKNKIRPQASFHIEIVPQVTHEEGWEGQWRTLLQRDLQCHHDLP